MSGRYHKHCLIFSLNLPNKAKVSNIVPMGIYKHCSWKERPSFFNLCIHVSSGVHLEQSLLTGLIGSTLLLARLVPKSEMQRMHGFPSYASK